MFGNCLGDSCLNFAWWATRPLCSIRIYSFNFEFCFSNTSMKGANRCVTNKTRWVPNKKVIAQQVPNKSLTKTVLLGTFVGHFCWGTFVEACSGKCPNKTDFVGERFGFCWGTSGKCPNKTDFVGALFRFCWGTFPKSAPTKPFLLGICWGTNPGFVGALSGKCPNKNGFVRDLLGHFGNVPQQNRFCWGISGKCPNKTVFVK